MCQTEQEDNSNFNAIKMLDKYSGVIFYEEESSELKDLLHFVDNDDFTLVNLNDAGEELRTLFIEHYKPKNIPFLLYRNELIYPADNVKETMNMIDNMNMKKYKNFIDDFVCKNGITVFIKGTLKHPKCKFARQLIMILTENKIENVKYFDILTDPLLRHYMKKIMDWPTFPQIFIKGKFYGGLNLFCDLVDSGELSRLFLKKD